VELETIEKAAVELGRVAREASRWPAQEGDILFFDTARSRTPINLTEWVEGFWNEPPPMGKLVHVVGDHDVPMVNAETGLPIHPEWGKTYVLSPVGAEFVTYSTKGAYILTKHDEPNDPKKRLLACLAEALCVYSGLPARRPDDEMVKRFTSQASDLFLASPSPTRVVMTNRYHDAPLLYGWPAPEWENAESRAFVRCAINGGKHAGKVFSGLPTSIEVPPWTL